MENIRKLIIQRVRDQAYKLLGPRRWTPGETYLRQWQAVYPDVAFTDTDDEFYPLSEREQSILAAARQLQYVQVGTGVLKSLFNEDMMPSLFIENATDGFTLADPDASNLMTVETMPLNLRLVILEPPIAPTDSEEDKFEKSNPVQVAVFRDALDYLMNPHVLRGVRGTTRGSVYSAEIRDALIVSSQNLEGLQAPMEAVDFRLEVTFERQKERFT